MKHMICKVTSVEVTGPHRLRVGFDDGIDPEAHTLAWPTGADFDPAMLHDWPEYADALNKWALELERQTA